MHAEYDDGTSYNYDEETDSEVDGWACDGLWDASTDYVYDADGRLQSEISDCRNCDWVGESHTYAYDAGGRLVFEEEDGEDGPGCTTYTYDADGRLALEEVDFSEPCGTTPSECTTYAYDDLGHLLRKEVSACGSAPYECTTREYDDDGRLLHLEFGDCNGDFFHCATYTYDVGNAMRETWGCDAVPLGCEIVVYGVNGMRAFAYDCDDSSCLPWD